MELKSKFPWGEVAAMADKRRAEMASELENYWNEIAPYGERFDADRTTRCCFKPSNGYEAALLRIAGKPDEQQALIDHRQRTGQEVGASDRDRLLTHRKTAFFAMEALGLPPVSRESCARRTGRRSARSAARRWTTRQPSRSGSSRILAPSPLGSRICSLMADG